MSKLPLFWKTVPLGDLAEYINGAAFKPSDWGEEGTPIIRIQNLTNPEKPFNRTTRIVSEDLLVKDGDILVSWSATLDAYIWNRGDAWLNQHIFRVLPHEDLVDRRFLYYLLKQEIVELIKSEHLHGSTMKHINRGPFLSHIVPLPPLEIQRHIVTNLDSFFAKSRRAREELAHVPRLVEHYKQAILTAAFRGDLTENGTANWPTITLGDIITNIEAGKNLRCEERPPAPNERGIVKVSSVTWGTFNPLASKTPAQDVILDERCLIQEGNFLISRANTLELVGACVIVGQLKHNNLYLSDKILRIRFNRPVEKWVLHYLRSVEGRQQIENLATGNQLSMRNISQSAIKAIRLPLPPEQVISDTVERIESSLSTINQLAIEAQRATALLNRLDQATLAKAFRGELVPQIPNQGLEASISDTQARIENSLETANY